MTRALVATAYGKPPVFDLVEVPVPDPGQGEVTVRVQAAALNPYDLQTVADGDPAKLPRRMAFELAGIVTAVGPDPIGIDGTALAVGDAVYGRPGLGAAAEKVTVKAGELLRRAGNVGIDEAAGLILVGSTAYHALEAIHVDAGDVVLVHGASGGVGSIAAQLAVARGARVIGTAAERHFERLRRYGIEPVAYGDGLADRVRALAPDGIDAAIDTVGTQEAFAVSLELLADPHQLVTIANFRDVVPAGGQAIGGGPGADPGTEVRAASRLVLAEELEAGRLHVPVAATFALDDAADAYALLASGHAGGKILLHP